MAVFHPHLARCVCGHQMEVHLADSINAHRFPASRTGILNGELHRFTCSSCHRSMTIEKPFWYTDLSRNTLFMVMPRGDRHTYRSASQALDVASKKIPESIAKSKGRHLRVVFGMDELREKLVAQDAGIDDRDVEMLKVLLVYEHPILIRRPRLRLTLERVSPSDFHFVAAYEHDRKRFGLQMPRELVEDHATHAALKSWSETSHKQSLYNSPDHWANMWKFSAQPSALEQLRAYASQIEAGQSVDTSAPAFVAMLDGIPRGSHLPPWAKKDLGTLFTLAKRKNLQALEDQLFQIRFSIKLDDDWSQNKDLNDIDTLWKLLNNLPSVNVEGSTTIHEILLDVDGDGGTYDPNTYDIAIGSTGLQNQEYFEDTVRHEVGHAVHEMKNGLVNRWLSERFGWRVFGTTEADVDQWVGLMGGWGSLSKKEKGEVRNGLITALGPKASWNPGPTPSFPAQHPWNGKTFGPRLAFEKTGPNWYRNYGTWHRVAGKAFFLNYWYKTLYAVDVTTLDLVRRMPDSYAAMSHYEFFAELYALYFDLDDPKRPNIPPDVATWFADNIAAPDPKIAMPASPAPKREWEGITRPQGKPPKTLKKPKK